MPRVVTMPPESTHRSDGKWTGGWWHETEETGRIVCDLCPRACSLKPGDRGFCFVRENVDGQMVLSTYGRSTGFCVDPIEKKPLNHFYPGSSVLSFGTAGCNLGCKFCQNWSISKSREVRQLSEKATPATIAEAARQLGCQSVAFTYNDPVIWAEYAIDTARECRAVGVKTVAVTAGYITPAARRPFFDAIDAANVDLKAFTENFYQHLTLSHLQPVLDTLEWLKKETDVWFEITNLVIPGENDSESELRRLCDWVLEHLGDEVPLHFSAFHPDFRLQDRPRTPIETLHVAYDVARRAGVKYVYVGNVHDASRDSTYCPRCGQVVIERDWYVLGAYRLDGSGCGSCGQPIAGHFASRPGTWGSQRLPVRISQYAPQDTSSHVLQRGADTMSANENETAVQGQDAQASLTPPQKQAIQLAASQIVAAAVKGIPPELSDPTLAGAARQTVLGCFVTIKRQGQLRGCCGFLGREAPRIEALTESAVASATRDVRMPSVSPTELEHLDLTVSFLHSFETVTAAGQARVGQVQVGRHGLQIVKGSSRGLLLPSVATEHGMNAEAFLRQVCVKAGLPPTAWREDDARIVTFETETFGGPFDKTALGIGQVASCSLFAEGQIQQLASACRDNVLALMRGATPTYYISHCPDGIVQGITVALTIPGQQEATRLSQLSLRPGLRLQSTLLDLANGAAQGLSRGGFYADTLDDLKLDLTVLHDPAMHGTIATPDLEGVDPTNRAILVIDKDRSATVFDPKRSTEQLVETAARMAQVRIPENASVMSLHADSTTTPVLVAAVPRAQTGPTQRPPAVAGMFYPKDEAELSRTIDDLLGEPSTSKRPWPAALVPHAGLIYSGRLAASVFQQIEIPETVIILAPKHTRSGVDWAVAPHDHWSLPGISVASDPQLAQELADAIDDLQLDAAAHAKEHAIEVELPILARLAPDSRVVGITIGAGNPERCHEFATGLADVIRGREGRTLLVISSDMNHFANDTETRRVDQLALESLASLDPVRLYDTVRQNQISMCGVLPAVIVMDTLRQLDRLHECQRVGYATSADVSGDTSRVVGYAGLLLG